VSDILERTRSYLTGQLLPFWIERSPDREHGGFLTYFDRDGRPTGKTEKTLLMQVRMLFTFASAHRAGYGEGVCAELAVSGAEFLVDHYWDDEHGGWFWTADCAGHPTNVTKVGYGQCFAMYALAEYYLATGDERGLAALRRTYEVVMERMADHTNGGYLEILDVDWRPIGPESQRKSFDVHMHMMEALTRVCEVGDAADVATRLTEVMDVIVGRMIDGVHGAGIQQFSLDFTPLPIERFDVRWGRDEECSVDNSEELVSYGHDVEFAWLLLRALDVLGKPRSTHADVVTRLLDHALAHGVDHELGGVFVEGPRGRPATNRHKQFWQQAELLVGMLEAWRLTRDQRYWDVFERSHAFVFDHFVRPDAGGEWIALADRDGTPLSDYLGDEWKISFHTVRSMIEVVRLLEKPC